MRCSRWATGRIGDVGAFSPTEFAGCASREAKPTARFGQRGPTPGGSSPLAPPREECILQLESGTQGHPWPCSRGDRSHRVSGKHRSEGESYRSQFGCDRAALALHFEERLCPAPGGAGRPELGHGWPSVPDSSCRMHSSRGGTGDLRRQVSGHAVRSDALNCTASRRRSRVKRGCWVRPNASRPRVARRRRAARGHTPRSGRAPTAPPHRSAGIPPAVAAARTSS